MKTVAKLILRTDITYLPTAFPAHYYGMPDGKVYLVFSRFYSGKIGETGLEFIFAEHKEFTYDYQNEKILPNNQDKIKTPVFTETVDKPNPKIDIIDIERGLRSYGEAYTFLNNRAEQMKIA